MVQQSSPVRQWIRLARNQVRGLNSLPLPHSPQQLAREGSGLWYNPNFINRQNIHLDLWSRHIHVHERQVPVVGSLPHAHWKASTLWLSYQTNNKQEKQKELQEKWLSNRKSSIYLFFFFFDLQKYVLKGKAATESFNLTDHCRSQWPCQSSSHGRSALVLFWRYHCVSHIEALP